MPLKLSVTISKKLGLPAYSSLGASCSVEVELDQSLIFTSVPLFHERVEQVYAVCRDAVGRELARQQGQTPVSDGQGAAKVPADSSNGHTEHRASQKQINYVKQLATQIQGLGARRLEELVDEMFGSPLAELSTSAASELINRLKRIKNGEIDLAALINGHSAD
jgi:hypothetical protein